MTVSEVFPRYRAYSPLVPVWRITPEVEGCIHRFFDTSPVSPSGRYVALTRLPSERRPPFPGEEAEVVLVDLEGGTTEIVARTRAVGSQLGAQVQWGRSDSELFYNAVDTSDWMPYAVRMDPISGVSTRLNGPVYMASPDGRSLASPCLRRTEITQAGYGVSSPLEKLPLNCGAAEDDGLYVTDVETGECRLLVSFQDIAEALPELNYMNGAFYGFHVKWNPQGTRLMFVIRYRDFSRPGNRSSDLITMNRDGSDIRLALASRDWSRGGHHPDWCPDGDRILMNLVVAEEGMRFVRFAYDGSGFEALSSLPGSGHPTMHLLGSRILTDAYVEESVAFGDGTVPIRWVDFRQDREQMLVRIESDPRFSGPVNAMRVDPHPAWDREFRRVVINGCLGGRRHVFLMDLS